ncbi:MAG: NADP-dependent glyceraldehyde-3-phosphate dehydrogenase [Microscillaceae bacterium]|jgi:glyceraldehyde-3-phosphate dehydrogenase (NADP+)|nr:NADP-dependent glyceraldehyde-3-phosphate dehydrogenase [Microscillaceae bacterium]
MATIQQIQTVFPQEADIPEKYRLPGFLEQTEYLIDGEIRHWSGEMNDILSPVMLQNEHGNPEPKIIGRTPLLTPNEALQALDAAVEAYDNGRGYWPNLTVHERIQHIEQFIEKMRQKRQEVVNLLMWEIGKSLKDSEKEFDRTVDYIIDTIDALKEADRTASNFVIEQGIIAQVRRVPLGVGLVMGPYNYPLNETFTTLIPALIVGNTVVFKPAKYGVLLIRPLLEAFRDCFPKGVVNIIFGSGRVLSGAIMQTGKLSFFAFIGTNRGANDLKKMHPKPHVLKSVLGLDAKNPAIVLPDADLENAAKECILGSLSYNGQRCTALKILFVHRQVVKPFMDLFCKELEKLKIGMPWVDDVKLTPLPEPDKAEYLSGLLADAHEHGAKVINEHGGTANNSFFYPAVVYPVNDKMRLYREEQFGPIVPIVPYEDVDTAIQYIVNSSFGQQASIFGNNPAKISMLIDILANQVSRININAQCQRGPDVLPFNGRKDSAEGTLSIRDALRCFSIRAMVATKYDEQSKTIIRQILKDGSSNFLRTDYIL